MKIKYTVIVIILISGFFSCTRPKKLNQNNIGEVDSLTKMVSSKAEFVEIPGPKWELNRFLKDSTANLLRHEILIKDTTQLISIAETILFDIYGKQEIIGERPYEIHLYGDYWIMMGTLPEGWQGGTFTIVINRRTCEVKGISHGK